MDKCAQLIKHAWVVVVYYTVAKTTNLLVKIALTTFRASPAGVKMANVDSNQTEPGVATKIRFVNPKIVSRAFVEESLAQPVEIIQAVCMGG